MFITNIEEFSLNLKEDEVYTCDKKFSKYLVKNGFSLLGTFKDKYYFYFTNELENFLNKGGE